MIHSSKTYVGVELGLNSVVEDFCIIGVAPRGKKEGELVTIIGADAHIRSHTIIYAGNQIGKNFQTGNKVNIRELNEIGDDVSIGTLSVIEHHVTIKNNVRIHSQVFIPEYTLLEEGSWLGPNVVLTNAKYPGTRHAKENLEGPIIKKGARIGANATILPGVVIGENSLVGAGSVVYRDIPPNIIVLGNPAKVFRKLKKEELPANHL